MARPNSEYGTPWVHIGWWTFFILIALLELSCGARRVDTSISKAVDKSTNKSTTEGQVKKESASEELKSSEETNTKEQLYWGKKIEEYFNPDGSLKSRVTSEEKGKITETLRRVVTLSITKRNTVDSTFKNNVVVTTYKSVYNKDKKSETSNRQWAWVVFGLGVVGLLFWLKPWQKIV